MQNDPSPPRLGRFESAYATEVHTEVHIYSGMTEDVHTATTGLYNLLYFVTEKVKVPFPRDRKSRSKGPFTLSVSDAVSVSGHR